MFVGIHLLDSFGKSLVQLEVDGALCAGAVEKFLVAYRQHNAHPPPIIETERVVLYSVVFATTPSLRLLAVSNKRKNAMANLAFCRKLANLIEAYAVPVSFIEHITGATKEEDRLVLALIESRECVLNCFLIIMYSLLFSFPQDLPLEVLYIWKEYVAKETTIFKRLKKSFERSSYLEPTEIPVLKEARKNDTSLVSLQEALSKVSWRPPGLFYNRNEVFTDITEHLECIYSSSGKEILSQVHGTLVLHNFTSGMPECRMLINSKLTKQSQVIPHKGNPDTDLRGIAGVVGVSSESITLDDVRYHPCVDLKLVEELDALSFVPPDGTFTLLEYRSSKSKSPLLVEGIGYFKERGMEATLELKVKSNLSNQMKLFEWKAEQVTVTVELPQRPYQVKSSSNGGKVEMVQRTKMVYLGIEESCF
uniref:Myo-inositol dehydrogenase n=1 Tax=Galdieria sulphuraria TaxID=130081 RepID=Q6JZK1_GALSU|nr:myo-inositol dehydrogenase [Galdieria sulphuraria]